MFCWMKLRCLFFQYYFQLVVLHNLCMPRPVTIDLLSTLVRTLHLMVGEGGMNLSFCASLYRRMNNSWKDLAIGSTSKKEGDVASRSITASCLV